MAEDRENQQAVVCNPDVLAKVVGDDTVLVHLKTNRIYELNRTAARLWALLDQGLSPTEIEQALVREFSVSPDIVRREMEALIEELVDERLLLRR